MKQDDITQDATHVASEMHTIASEAVQRAVEADLKVGDPPVTAGQAAIAASIGGYSWLRCTGITCYVKAAEMLGRPLTHDERRAIWDNKDDQQLIDMGR